MLLFLLLSCLHKAPTPIEAGRIIGAAAGQAASVAAEGC
jgi:hypothetical protein